MLQRARGKNGITPFRHGNQYLWGIDAVQFKLPALGQYIAQQSDQTNTWIKARLIVFGFGGDCSAGGIVRLSQ